MRRQRIATLRGLLKGMGYVFNHRFFLKVGSHDVCNTKLGGWTKPLLWIDGVNENKVSLEVLDELIEALSTR